MSATTDTVPAVRWGVVATGRIAATVSKDLDHVPGAVRQAVASRDQARAAGFARDHGFAVAHGSYADLVEDPQVDVVYVATPHPQHLAAAELALRAGTPVLVEKPVTATLAGAERLVAVARETGTFCMEAMWTRFLPNGVRLAELVRGGAIGEVRTVHADLGFRAPDDPTSRYFSPALGGGALLDVGVYPIALAQQLLGAPESVQVAGALTATGVDGDVALLLRHRSGASALLSASITSSAASAAWVEGTGGRIEVPRSFERMPALHVVGPDGEAEVVDLGRSGTGYAHMLEHVQQCLAQGLRESPVMPLSDTLDVMRVVDTAQRALGLSPSEDG